MLRFLPAVALFAACVAIGPSVAKPTYAVAADRLASPIPADSRQLVLVTTADWTATTGSLQRYEREPGRAWGAVGEAIEVVVGRSGLGWGTGLHAAQDGPQKREGDGRAPAGAFRLSAAFGYAEIEATGLPYVVAQPSTQCVDDPTSVFYNLVLDSTSVGSQADWSSKERMRRNDALYRIGVVVAHNGPGVAESELAETLPDSETRPGNGSCIFLHVWNGPGSTTSGCTAMPDASLQSVLAWLQANAEPVLVQLPAPERKRLTRAWALPG